MEPVDDDDDDESKVSRKRSQEDANSAPSMEKTMKYLLANRSAISKENFVQVMVLLVQMEQIGVLTISALTMAYEFLTRKQVFQDMPPEKWRAYFEQKLLPLMQRERQYAFYFRPERVTMGDWDESVAAGFSPKNVFMGFLFQHMNPWIIHFTKDDAYISFVPHQGASMEWVEINFNSKTAVKRLSLQTNYKRRTNALGIVFTRLLQDGWEIQEKAHGESSFQSRFPKEMQSELIEGRYRGGRRHYYGGPFNPGRLFRRGVSPLWRGPTLRPWRRRRGLWYPWWYWLSPEYYDNKQAVAVTYEDGSVRYLIPPYRPGTWGNYGPPPAGAAGYQSMPMYGELLACDHCEVKPALVGCGHGCETAYYCGQECADAHYGRHDCGRQ